MGIWTHVNCTVKVDCKNKIDEFYQYFGKEIVYRVNSDNYRDKETYQIDWERYYADSQKEFVVIKQLWDEYKQHPELFLPVGSEGSLHLESRLTTVVKNTVYPYRYKVMIYGGLRDHYDVGEVVDCIRGGIQKILKRHDCALLAEAKIYNYIDGECTFKYETSYFRDKDAYRIKEPYTGS